MGLKIDYDQKLCFINDQPLDLSKTEFNIIYFFVNNKGKIFSRKELVDNIWNKDVSERTVDTNITRLRKKLGDEGKRIITRQGFGYGFE